MKILTTAHELQSWRASLPTATSVVLVPTMGGLHRGHMALINHGHTLKRDYQLVVSLFVNPLQFEDAQDLATYPSSWEQDLAILRELKVAALFAPGRDFAPAEVTVRAGQLAQNLHGQTRPGHLDGVCSIVFKLFELIKPDDAIFGEKDYQQLLVIQDMVQRYHLPIKVVAVPTQRHRSGLAWSTRNRRLSAAGLEGEAPKLYQGIGYGCQLFQASSQESGGSQLSPATLIARLRDWYSTHAPAFEVVSIDVLDPHRLQAVSKLQPETMIFVAVRLEGVSLIDHCALQSFHHLQDEAATASSAS